MSMEEAIRGRANPNDGSPRNNNNTIANDNDGNNGGFSSALSLNFLPGGGTNEMSQAVEAMQASIRHVQRHILNQQNNLLVGSEQSFARKRAKIEAGIALLRTAVSSIDQELRNIRLDISGTSDPAEIAELRAEEKKFKKKRRSLRKKIRIAKMKLYDMMLSESTFIFNQAGLQTE